MNGTGGLKLEHGHTLEAISRRLAAALASAVGLMLRSPGA